VSLLGDESLFQHTITGTAAGAAMTAGAAAVTAMVVRKEVRLRVGREHLSEKLYCKVYYFFALNASFQSISHILLYSISTYTVNDVYTG
jgi:hypothetical protein